ncbi:HEAT repeat domain-containing protein [Kitasatospora sp. NPDC058115]|uniref:HEAT repeat domain-containing protein n=1 Tax=Kitasatospora sp. NPDC058115 TaxID=3346347 RepID=UPI0036DCB9E9
MAGEQRAAERRLMAERRLVAAVIARNAAAVRACLEEGADPDTRGPDGLPLLCLAVAGFDHATAEALTDADPGADPDRELPDGTTPLLRAVDLGSPALVEAVLGKDPALRIPAPARQRLLDLARRRYETGEEEELRRRTGADGPAVRRRMRDGDHVQAEEVAPGRHAVRAGHGSVLTLLEQRFGVLPPVAEVVARGIRRPDDDDAWFTAAHALAGRRSERARSELASLRHHPDPVRRLFLAEVLWHRVLLAGAVMDGSDSTRDVGMLAAWAFDEPDGRVLGRVLAALLGRRHPAGETLGLRHAGHPDPRVRREVPYLLSPELTGPGEAATAALLVLADDPDGAVRASVADALETPGVFAPDVREALLRLLRDSDLAVRARAAATLAGSGDRTAAVTEALAALLDEEHRTLRLEAAYALARRDDPRTEDAYARVGPLGPGFEHDHRVSAHWQYRSRNRPGGH